MSRGKGDEEYQFKNYRNDDSPSKRNYKRQMQKRIQDNRDTRPKQDYNFDNRRARKYDPKQKKPYDDQQDYPLQRQKVYKYNYKEGDQSYAKRDENMFDIAYEYHSKYRDKYRQKDKQRERQKKQRSQSPYGQYQYPSKLLVLEKQVTSLKKQNESLKRRIFQIQQSTVNNDFLVQQLQQLKRRINKLYQQKQQPPRYPLPPTPSPSHKNKVKPDGVDVQGLLKKINQFKNTHINS